MSLFLRSLLLVTFLQPTIGFAQSTSADRPITLQDVSSDLPEISADEPLAGEFSAVKAAEYLDRSSLNWIKSKNCVTCHSTLFCMMARPALHGVLPDSGELREFFENYRAVRWKDKGPTQSEGFWPIVVGTGLTFNDLQTTGRLSDVSRDVLDMMWSAQRDDGGWSWPDCDYAPIEEDEHYGVTVAALTIGAAPDDYKNTPQSLAGLEKMRSYFQNNPPLSLHHRAMLAWVSARLDGIMTQQQRRATLDEILSLQCDDGGWSTAGFLSDWDGLERSDGEPLKTRVSDSYGTGLVIVIARELGVPSDDPRLRRGIDWIKSNQRESGMWFTESPVNEAGNLISNAGTALVVMALQACGELPGWPLGAKSPGAEAATAVPTDFTGQTEHFWYRLAPSGPTIDSQRDHLAFGFDQENLFLSEDNGQTWTHRTPFPGAKDITFSCFFKNGNVLFATGQHLYLSTDKLRTYRPITVLDRNGNDYPPHDPVDPDQPGWYFNPLDGEHIWEVGGTEMLVWGNYCNVIGGAAPVNIHYSVDNGQTVKIAYSFGQNPKFQQPGSTPETMLGDPTNPLIARHVHGVTYNPAENAFYACTGDLNRGWGDECHWLRGTYDARSDAWDWQVLVTVDSDSRFKSGGLNVVDDQLYWVADANGPKLGPQYDRGIFRCAPGDLTDKSAHTRLYDMEFESATMIIQDGVILAALDATASTATCGFIISPDMGKTWAQYDLKELGTRSGYRFSKKNSDGWFRVDLRKDWIHRADVLFIKPKPIGH